MMMMVMMMMVVVMMMAGMTALLLAVDADYSACVRELLYAGASPDGPCLMLPEETESVVVRRPLMAAMSNNSVDSLRLLLQAGCRLDMLSRLDDGQLMLASELLATRRCTDVVRRLVVTAATALRLPVQLEFSLSPTRLDGQQLNSFTFHYCFLFLFLFYFVYFSVPCIIYVVYFCVL